MYDICLHEVVVRRNYQHLAASGRYLSIIDNNFGLNLTGLDSP